MLQIKKLTSTNCHITDNEQKKILGGGAGPHNTVKTPYALWKGYANDSYSIDTEGQIINFSRGDYVVGAIDSETGESQRVSNLDNIY